MMSPDEISSAFAKAKKECAPSQERNRAMLENLSLAVKALQDAGVNLTLQIQEKSSIEALAMAWQQDEIKKTKGFTTIASGRLTIDAIDNNQGFYVFLVLSEKNGNDGRKNDMSHLCIASRPGSWGDRDLPVAQSSFFDLLDADEIKAFQATIIETAANYSSVMDCDKGGVFNKNPATHRNKRTLYPPSAVKT